MNDAIRSIIAENDRRLAEVYATFNPITGEGSVGERRRVSIPDFPIPVMWLPTPMLEHPFMRKLLRCRTIAAFLRSVGSAPDDAELDRHKVIDVFTRLRCQYDFPFWAAFYVYIKNKGGGDDVLFRLTRPQRRFVQRLEELRLAQQPIRLVLLKARQWGGSTTSQIYMAWLQLVHQVGLNSLIIAHQSAASDEIKDMFDRMIKAYPVSALHPLGEPYAPNEPKLVGVGRSGGIHRVPQRNCKIKIGTAESPDGCRGGDYNLVHLSEVGLWRTTDGKRPEDIVRSACSGVLLKPLTMIVYESTANGTGNFFKREYDDAKAGHSQFQAMFVSWFDIEQYSLPIDDVERFATELYNNRSSEVLTSNRAESGRYLWWLWERGATLQAIAWYIAERAKYNDHAVMASEFPSDDVEAFVHSGARVFDRYHVEAFRSACRPPRLIGEVFADADEGRGALTAVRFKPDSQGSLYIWDEPEPDDTETIVTDRYLVVVDVGGRSHKADFSVILVIDRLFMPDGDPPVVVAQWYGHCDIDILAWRAAQIAAYYNNALLVIESNTLETHDRERAVEGDQSAFILNQIKEFYPNLYARRQSEEDIRNGTPRKYGFHTNVATKPMIISTLVKMIREHRYIERDERCLDEFLCYERKPNGAYGAIVGKHDDLLMTRAIGLHICFFEMPLPRVVGRAAISSMRTKPKIISEASI